MQVWEPALHLMAAQSQCFLDGDLYVMFLSVYRPCQPQPLDCEVIWV